MKLLLFISVVFVATFARAEDRKIIGTFESVPIDMLAMLPGPATEKSKEQAAKTKAMFEKMKQTLVITEKDLTLSVGGVAVYMTYTTQGDFILGKTVLGNSEMFYPIYAKDADTLFLAGQKFVRKKEEVK
ncbi:MAG TPA: hypothetical protein VFD27_17240 [Chthoniobacteraceae bacterium]|jgi:hypothetical protein|nr:hypothetical protein [Chthoniobacteraceae bacterium]